MGVLTTTRSKSKPIGQKLNGDALQIIDVRHSSKGKEVLA